MGADFMLIIVPVVEDVQARIETAIKALPDEAVESLEEYGFYPDRYAKNNEDWRQALIDWMSWEFEQLPGSREVAEVVLDGKSYWATGGMSWGEDPTNAWQALLLIEFFNHYEGVTL